MQRIDFKAVAEAALARADSLVPQWVPGGSRQGAEYKALNPMRGDSHVGSFSINLVTGAWGDFASGDTGGDLVSLYAYLFTSGDQLQAARELAESLGLVMPESAPVGRRAAAPSPAPSPAPADESAPAKKKREPSPWKPILPVPEGAGDPPRAHEFRGVPERVWAYRDGDGRVLGYVCRFITSDGGKDIIPLHFCRHEVTGAGRWSWISAPDPRPLYGLDRLASAPVGMPVLVVEGEKCADVAAEQLPDYVTVSWPGGGKAVPKADWSALAGRSVVLWPDCDAQRDKKTQELLPEEKQPGIKAMRAAAEILLGYGCTVGLVDIPPPGAKPSGWDIADAVGEGWDTERLRAFVRDSLRPYEPEPEAGAGPDAVPPESISTPTEAGAGKRGFIPGLIWKKDGLSSCLSNVFQVLSHSPAWQGVVGFDEFAQRTTKLKPPPYADAEVGEWDSMDDSRTSIWLSQFDPDWKFTPASPVVAEAVEVLARANSFHPVREYLEQLPSWDGTPRLPDWLTDCLGVEKTEYSQRVGTWFIQAMVARVMEPGCKFDYCLVLEGTQGRGKSTALKILGGEWFADTDLDLHNKDSMAALRGKWVYEIAELGALAKSESLKQKSFLSRQVDEFRPVYGRREIKCARQVVFAGTTNEWEWNKDPTGGRRFWPIEVGDIDHAKLIEQREMLLAEALWRYRKGKRFHPTAEEQKTYFDPVQLKVEQQESYIDVLHDWVEAQTSDFSLAMAVMEGMKLDASKLSRDLQTRVGAALRKLGCTKVEKRNGMTRFWYRPPNRKVASSSAGASERLGEEADYVAY